MNSAKAKTTKGTTMTKHRDLHDDLLNAAEALLEAKDNQMETRVEWNALRKAASRLRAKRTAATSKTELAPGTEVLSTIDGERGTIINAFVYDSLVCEWTEYQVETANGIECWKRHHFVVMSEAQASD